MAWVGAAIRAAQAAGRHPGGKPGRRGPRPIGGPGKGRKPRKLTTSEAAIRRFEQRKRGGTGRTPTRKPWGRQGGPRADARPTGGGRRTSRTSRTAISRSRARLGRARLGRVAGRVARAVRRR